MTATFFETPAAFRAWLEKHYETETELIVGFYKVGSGKPSMTWSESVDQALCFGWIDGIRRSIDHESYCIRFTPRKRTSIWSPINIKKIAELQKAGLMTSKGQKAFDLRSENMPGIYAPKTEPALLDPAYEAQFKMNTVAWDFFNAQAASYKRLKILWIMDAKQEKTRLSRLEKIITASGQQKRIL